MNKIRNDNYDIFLIDYSLGEKTGIDLIDEIQNKDRDIPVIILTGHDDYSIDLVSMKKGVSDFLVKSKIDAEKLERSIRYAIENKRSQEVINILLVEDDESDYLITKEMLSEIRTQKYNINWIPTYEKAVSEIQKEDYDIFLIDYSLGVKTGIDLMDEIQDKNRNIPIIILTGLDDYSIDILSMKKGVSDFLVKGKIDTEKLERSIRYAIENKRSERLKYTLRQLENLNEQLRMMSLKDELTGLFNRRGFITLAEQYIKLSKRMKRNFIIFYMDIDNLKTINDTYGHHEGDILIMSAAEVLKLSFREADVLARIGGDEFTVLSINTSVDDIEEIERRLLENVNIYNRRLSKPYRLSISYGTSDYKEGSTLGINELLSEADASLYEQKKAKKQISQK